MIVILHEGHQDIHKICHCARDSIYWPGIDREIEDVGKCCHQCLAHLSVDSKEPLEQLPIPTRPWEKLGVDLLSLNGNKYLLIPDNFSFFTEVHDLQKNGRAPIMIKKTKKTFCWFGIPVEVVSDGGSQLKWKDFWRFLQRMDFSTHCIVTQICTV